jgi:hypothetical protein
MGGIVRLRRGVSTLGVLITHVGILMLLVAGLVKLEFSHDGHLTLYEGQSSNAFESFHEWELAILEQRDGAEVREFVAPDELFSRAAGAERVRIRSQALPFELELHHFVDNARVLPKGPMVPDALPVVDGYVLDAQPKDPENELNVAGVYVTVLDPAAGAPREGLLWGAARQPLTIESGGRTFGLELRRERYLMPFTVTMDDFVKEDHPRISMAKAFSSDVTVVEEGSARQVKIEMNEPLRSHGLVLYQSSWGPSNARPGDRLFSTLSVVRNPADQYPLYACIVIALGLSLHFSRKLVRHIRSEAVQA